MHGHMNVKQSTYTYNGVKIKLVVWGTIWLTKVIRYNVDAKLYKNGWIGNVLAGDCVQVVCTKSNVGRKTVQIVEKGLNNFYANKDISIALS
jgi:hypothetical protein